MIKKNVNMSNLCIFYKKIKENTEKEQDNNSKEQEK